MAELQEIPGRVEAVRSSLREVRESLKVIGADLTAIASDPMPTEFEGIIISYSYGNGDGTGPYGRPSHRLIVQARDGLWLYVNVGSDKMDEFIEAAKLVEVNAEALIGQSILVRRDPDYADGRIVPVKLLSEIEGDEREYFTFVDGSPIVDRNGNSLYVDAKVIINNDYNDLRSNAKVTGIKGPWANQRQLPVTSAPFMVIEFPDTSTGAYQTTALVIVD